MACRRIAKIIGDADNQLLITGGVILAARNQHDENSVASFSLAKSGGGSGELARRQLRRNGSGGGVKISRALAAYRHHQPYHNGSRQPSVQ